MVGQLAWSTWVRLIQVLKFSNNFDLGQFWCKSFYILGFFLFDAYFFSLGHYGVHIVSGYLCFFFFWGGGWFSLC